MKPFLSSLIFFFCFLYNFHAQTYITNVTVLDVEKKKVLENQTVEITNDLISNIASSKKNKQVEGDTIIDGTDKFLIPGLTDAHIHFFQSGGLYTRPDAIDLRKHTPYNEEIEYALNSMEEKLMRYLENGITNVIDVGATYNFLKERKKLEGNTQLPSVYMTGPLLTTYEPDVYKNLEDNEPFSLVKTIDDGIKMVQEQLPYKPDFIKIWYIASLGNGFPEENAKKYQPVIKAIIDESHKHNLKVAVHATERITAQLAVESGCDFLVHNVEDEVVVDAFLKLLKEKQVIVCPTMVVHSGYNLTFGQNLNFNEHELLKANPLELGSLLDLKHLPDSLLINQYKQYFNSDAAIANYKKSDSIRKINLKKMSDAGVLIATGTDAGNIGTLHASSYLNEALAMKESGMSNWKILEASTINGAKILDKENEFGSISKGKKANMVLLNANPVEDIANISNINVVINNGNIFQAASFTNNSPESLAQRQLNAYNLRNIEAFLEPYAENVEVYMFPEKLLYKGKETMRQQYASMFQQVTNLHCELKERIVQDNIVIDKERVRFGEQVIEAVAIYHIENGKIKKVYFIQ